MLIIFRRKDELVYIIPDVTAGCTLTSCFRGSNNADSRSKGIWPSGLYRVEALRKVYGEDSLPAGKFGGWFLDFENFKQSDGKTRVDMGLHSGREGVPDGRGRCGYQHATMGCIRVEPAAMSFIADRWNHDKVTKMWVE